MKQEYSEHCHKDPVCGMEVSRISAVDHLLYQGKTYYFCAGNCRQEFEANPEKYIRVHRQHGLKQV